MPTDSPVIRVAVTDEGAPGSLFLSGDAPTDTAGASGDRGGNGHLGGSGAVDSYAKVSAGKEITEAREGGTAGIFDSSGGMRTELIGEIALEVGPANVIFEAPSKAAQVCSSSSSGRR